MKVKGSEEMTFLMIRTCRLDGEGCHDVGLNLRQGEGRALHGNNWVGIFGSGLQLDDASDEPKMGVCQCVSIASDLQFNPFKLAPYPLTLL